MYRILFFGTSEFAVPSLKSLLRDGRFEIAGAITQPDRPFGRHAVITPPAVKVCAEEHAILVHQPEKLNDETFKSWIQEVGPSCDAFVIVSYGKILPQWLLDLPKNGVINVHGSILPRWRGASPIHSAIAHGDTETGITIMLIDAQMDHGPILETTPEPILPSDTTHILHDRLAELGGAFLPQTLAGYLNGTIKPLPQQHELATTCKILTREDGKIEPKTQTAIEIERMVRAYNPWPGAWTIKNGKRMKIHEAKIVSEKENHDTIACADKTFLQPTVIQMEGKNITRVQNA